MRTAVINVLALLQLCGDRAAVMCAVEQARKGKRVLPMLRLVASRENILNSVESVAGNQRLMRALVLDALPEEISQIKTILENLFEIRARQAKTKFVQRGPTQGSQRSYESHLNPPSDL